MTKLSWLGIMVSLFLLVAPAQAQQADPALDWQAVITGQVEAFRAHDAPMALGFASTAFKQRFTDPEAFVAAIREWGYAAIMESRSHSFGPYQEVEPGIVIQRVTFTGPDQALYEAIYQLNRETDGWRIGGVQLLKTEGIGV